MAAVSWLLRTDTERERMLDMDRRLAPIRRAALGVLDHRAPTACRPRLGNGQSGVARPGVTIRR
jgi:hypothetical protein